MVFLLVTFLPLKRNILHSSLRVECIKTYHIIKARGHAIIKCNGLIALGRLNKQRLKQQLLTH